MSTENVEIVRHIFDAVGRRDPEAVLALYDPDVELDFSHTEIAEFFEQSIFHGHDGLRSYDREWREAFENVETDCEELIEAGEHVISVARYRMRGRASGIEVPGKETARPTNMVNPHGRETLDERNPGSGPALRPWEFRVCSAFAASRSCW